MQYENLRQRLSEEMRERGLSIREVAREVGVAHTTIMRVLNGRKVSIDTLQNISRFLDADPGDFFPTGQEDQDFAKDIAALIGQEPALAEILHQAVEETQKGAIPPSVLREIVRYAAWRIHEESAKDTPARKPGRRGQD